MALAHRRPYGIYRWLANAPRWLTMAHHLMQSRMFVT